MASKPDQGLMSLNAQYSFPAVWDGSTPYDQIRTESRKLRETLNGSFEDQVEVVESEGWRLFSPISGAKDDVAVIYVHGGGWCNCDPYTHGGIMSDLAALTGRSVYGLRYPLAPENPYPAALDVVCSKISELSNTLDVPFVLAGDSAGANLALASALRLRDEGKGLALIALLLWYGCYRANFETRSHLAYGDGTCGLSTDAMRLFWKHYLGSHAAEKYADLTSCDMHDLPQVYLCEAECDCLADDSRWLAGKLMEAGVPHFYDAYANATHGFLHHSKGYPSALNTLKQAAVFVDQAFLRASL